MAIYALMPPAGIPILSTKTVKYIKNILQDSSNFSVSRLGRVIAGVKLVPNDVAPPFYYFP